MVVTASPEPVPPRIKVIVIAAAGPVFRAYASDARPIAAIDVTVAIIVLGVVAHFRRVRMYIRVGVITVHTPIIIPIIRRNLNITIPVIVRAAFPVKTLPVRAVRALVTIIVSAVREVVAVVVNVVGADFCCSGVYGRVVVVAVGAAAP